MSLVASNVMDRAAVLMNDAAKDLFTYDVQLPYLQIANDEFSDNLVDNGIGQQKKTASNLTITAGTTSYTPLPTDLLIPENCWERPTNQTDQNFVLMVQKEWTPKIEQGVDLRWWIWQNSQIQFLGATQSVDVKLEYIRILGAITTSGSSVELGVLSENYLAHRTASLLAKHIGRNKGLSDDLRMDALVFLNTLLRICVKQNQATPTKRRPFRISGLRRFR